MNAAQGIARQVCGILMTLSSTMMHSLNPVIVKKAGSHNQESLINVSISGSKLSFLLVILIAFPVLFELPFLLGIWLTDVPEYALPFCVFEVIQQIIASFTVALVTMIGGVGDIKAFQFFSSITYILRLPLVYLSFLLGANPLFAYYIATTAVIVLCIGRVYYAISQKDNYDNFDLPVARYLKGVIGPCLILCCLVASSLFIIITFIPSTWIRLVITTLVAVSEILILSYSLVFDKDERMLVHQALAFVKSKLCQR